MRASNLRILHCPALLLAATTGAQAPTVTASVTRALTVLAAGNPNSQQSTPVGPLPAGGVQLSASTISSSASLRCGPTSGHASGVAGFELRASGSAFPNFSSPAAYNIDGEVVLQLGMPSPTPVLVIVRGSASRMGTGGSGSTLVDLRNDLTIDFTVATPASGTVDTSAEFGLLVGPGGIAIRISHQSSGAWNGIGLAPSTGCDVDLTFYPGASPITAYGAGCMPLTFTRDPTGAPTLRCPSTAPDPVFFLFGLNAMAVLLPFPPGCLQLTDILTFLPVVPAGGAATLSLPNVPLPPGLEILAQAVLFQPSSIVLTSNGLSMLGPN
jgi:hypothetical protein